MRGLGALGDILVLGLGALTVLGWMYLWFLCVFGAEKAMSRLFGEWAFPIAALGYPVAMAVVLGLAIKILGRHNLGWALAVFGVLLPTLGIIYLRKEAK